MPAPVIFLIDDHASVRHALGEMLNVFGYTVETYDSADSFLAGLSANGVRGRQVHLPARVTTLAAALHAVALAGDNAGRQGKA